MIKIFGIIVAWLIAITVVNNIVKSMHKKDTKENEETVCCIGCKNLEYFNDGSPCCIKNIDHACITSGFKLREPKD